MLIFNRRLVGRLEGWRENSFISEEGSLLECIVVEHALELIGDWRHDICSDVRRCFIENIGRDGLRHDRPHKAVIDGLL